MVQTLGGTTQTEELTDFPERCFGSHTNTALRRSCMHLPDLNLGTINGVVVEAVNLRLTAIETEPHFRLSFASRGLLHVLTIEYMEIFPHNLPNSPARDVDLIFHWGGFYGNFSAS
jgi:hypothetical protein